MFERYLIYFIFAVITGIAALAVIPKECYKKYLLYAIFLGGVGNAVLAPTFSKIFHLIKYKSMGYFNILMYFRFGPLLPGCSLFPSFSTYYRLESSFLFCICSFGQDSAIRSG